MGSGSTDLRASAPFCAYTGKPFTKKFRPSWEHIVPKSKGGASNITNYLVAEREVNSRRGNMPLDTWFKLHPNYAVNVQNYLDYYKKVDLPYKEAITKTLNRACHSITFRGHLDTYA